MCGPQLHGKRLLMGRPRAGHARPLQCFPIVPYIPRKSKAPRHISGEQNYYTRFSAISLMTSPAQIRPATAGT